jgi:hypothetical protein
MPLAGLPDTPAEYPPAGALSVWRRVARRAAVVHRKTLPPDSRNPGWAAKLEQVIAGLDALNRSTEVDFLAIGHKLTEFMQTVKLISSELTALVNLLSGEYGPRASQALTSALDRSKEMSANAEENNGLLSGMRLEADRLGKTLSGFKGTLTTFHTIGVLTRVETARLGSAGADFGSLAEDVKVLAGDIQARIESAVDTAAELVPTVENVLLQVSAMEAEQAHDLPPVIAGVMTSLESSRDMQTRMRDAAVRLAERYDAISAAFGNLVVSIQFHDITRQQVEHVIEVLRRLGSEPVLPRDAGAVLALQGVQLAGAGEKFSASVAGIAGNLNSIAANVLEMAGESQRLSGVSDDEKDSFFLELEQGLSAILAGFGGCAEAEQATRAASSGMAETIGRMCRAANEIQAIEIQMRRMALNASIRAAHLGAPGNVLAILADAMQKLASESAQRSASLLEALGSMTQAATRLSGQDGRMGVGEQDTAVQGLRTAVDDMHSLSERGFAQIAQIIARSSSLSEDLAAARDGFSVGALFASAIGRARGALQTIAGESPSDWPSTAASASPPGLADFARHYTMQSEREVHQAALKPKEAAAPIAVLAGPARPAGSRAREVQEFGDNVEMF